MSLISPSCLLTLLPVQTSNSSFRAIYLVSCINIKLLAIISVYNFKKQNYLDLFDSSRIDQEKLRLAVLQKAYLLFSLIVSRNV